MKSGASKALAGKTGSFTEGGRGRVIRVAVFTLAVLWLIIAYGIYKMLVNSHDEIQRDAERAGLFLQMQVNLSLGIMDSVFGTLDVARSQLPDPYAIQLIARPAATIVLQRFDAMVLSENGREIPLGTQTRKVEPLPACAGAPEAGKLVVSSQPEMMAVSYRLSDSWDGVSFLCAKAGKGLLHTMLNNAVGDKRLNARLAHEVTGQAFESATPAQADSTPLIRLQLRDSSVYVEVRPTATTWWAQMERRAWVLALMAAFVHALLFYSTWRSWQYVIALESAAIRDGLTGLLNRRYLFERADFELQRQRRVHEPIGVLLLDIDYFKKVNDTYGHDAGDDVLRAVATLLNNQCRGTDIVARYGGEEFVILFPSTNTDNAMLLAQRLRTSVEAMTVATAAGPLRVTFSGGLAMAAAEEVLTLETLITRADVALYAAKHDGRNRIVLAESQAGGQTDGQTDGQTGKSGDPAAPKQG